MSKNLYNILLKNLGGIMRNPININNIKNFFHDIMFENKVIDREAGFDTQIVLQIFGIIAFILIFIHI